MLNAFQSIQYFHKLGLTLQQSPGRRRGNWQLGLLQSHENPNSFASLKECWDWWRQLIIRTITEDESASIAVELSLRDADMRDRITRWALSKGWEELPDDLFCAINYPFLTFEPTDQRWRFLPRNPIGQRAWTAHQSDYYDRLLSKLSKRDRQALARATSAATEDVSTPKRL